MRKYFTVWKYIWYDANNNIVSDKGYYKFNLDICYDYVWSVLWFWLVYQTPWCMWYVTVARVYVCIVIYCTYLSIYKHRCINMLYKRFAAVNDWFIEQSFPLAFVIYLGFLSLVLFW